MNISGLYAINCKKVTPSKNMEFEVTQLCRIRPNSFFTSIPNASKELNRLLKYIHGKKGVGYSVIEESSRHIKIKTSSNVEYTYTIERVLIKIK